LLSSAIKNRKSHRKFLQVSLSIKEISYLLWATQGIRKKAGGTVLRTVPSAGNRHAIETYLLIIDVEGLEPGIYRYLPLEHQLVFESSEDDLPEKIADATLGQYFIGTAPVVFVWTTIPYRMEWRYSLAAHKVIAIDAGHICQNLYLACEAIKAGTCAVAAYHQGLMDELIGIDGEDEFTIYLAPVGRISI
jgi:SagB-type dehydrogenase family enzyme